MGARKLHVQRVFEDADVPSILYTGPGISPTIPIWPDGDATEEFTTPLDDAMAHVVDEREAWSRWNCDCGQPNDGHRLNCCMCGCQRDDV